MRPPVFDPAWAQDVVALYRHDVQEMWDPSLAPHIWNQYHNQLDIYLDLASEPGTADILDVGCAQATLALLLAERGYRVCAMDIRQQFLDYAALRHERGDIRFVCGNALEEEPGGKFDLIFANQIIEHLVHPLEFVRRLMMLLKPHGRLVVTTPNGSYVKNSLPSFAEIGDVEQHEHLQFSADGDGHFFAYRADELSNIFVQAGFAEAHVDYFETPWISGHMKLRYLHDWMPVSILRRLDRLSLRVPLAGARVAHQLIVIGRSQ
jgi:SAM-dependent methyltransferase